jgi:MYXO-CTERM domain-containing protein
MLVFKFKNAVLGFVFAGCAAAGGNASAQGLDDYRWDGLCADCLWSGTPALPVTTMLEFNNHTAGFGSPISRDSFESITHWRPDGSSDPAEPAIGGWGFVTSVDADAEFSLARTGGADRYSFQKTDFSEWVRDMNGRSLNAHREGGGHQNEYHDHESTHLLFVHHQVAGGYATPVPEADSYALLLAGLGLLGVYARRRKLTSD